MKKMLAGTLLSSVVWTTQISAQVGQPGRLAYAIAREAARVSTSENDVAWSRVMKIAPETEVSVVVAGTVHSRRHFVMATDRELFLLNTVDSQLPFGVRQALLRLLSRAPDDLARAYEKPVVEGAVTVGPAGVALNGQALVGLSKVVERYDRHRVIEVSRARRARGTFTGNFGGLFVIAGAVTGVILGARYGHDQFKSHKGVGAGLGALGGYLVGFGAGMGTVKLIERLDDYVVYRASAASAATGDKP